MGSDEVSDAGGFRFNAAAAVPRAMGSAVFAKSKVSKRRGLNRWESGQDHWEFTGTNPFVAAIGRGGSRGLGDGQLNVDLGIGDSVRLDLSGNGRGDVGARIGGDGSEFCGRILEKELPGELKKLNANVGGKVESSVAAGKLGGRAVVTSELPERLRKLNLGDDTSLAKESGITDSNFHAVDQSIVFESIVGRDGNPSSTRVDTELSDDMENKLNIGDRSQVSFAKALPLESSPQEEVTSECVDDSRNHATETVADAASSEASAKDGAFSSSCGTQLEENGSFSFIGKQSYVVTPFAEFTTPSSKVTFVSSANEKIEFAAKRETSDFSRIKKKKGKFKPSAHVHSHLMQDLGSNLDSSSGKQEASDSYSPMDVSPYQQMLSEDGCSTQTSATLNDPNIFDKDHVSDVSHPSCVKDNSKDNLDEELVFATHRMHIYGNGENGEADEDVSLDNCNRNVDTGGLVEECVTGAETESFKSATEDIEFILDDAISSFQRSQASSSSYTETENDRKKEAHNAAPLAEGTRGSSFTFTASSSHQGQSSMMRQKTKKKLLTDAGCGSFKLGSCSEDSFTSARSYLSSEVQSVTSHSLECVNQFTYPSESGRQAGSSSVKGRGIKLGSESISATTLAAQEACEKWRLRGNQAYTSGDALKAEECYTQGIDSIQKDMVSRSCLRALMLCYSNRAATRMSLGRLSDAIQDCMMAIFLDPNFFKAQVRAANCFLSLGKINDALPYYKRCLQPGNDTRADRKITVEASEGLQKAQKLSECINQSAKLLMRKTTKDVEGALEIIDEALLISPLSERLLQMKAEALFVLQMYEEVIQLCEDTLDSAEKNFSTTSTTSQTNNEHGLESSRLKFKLWRCSLMFKSYFQLGRLEQGVASIERNEISNLGAVQSLVETARELLRLKERERSVSSGDIFWFLVNAGFYQIESVEIASTAGNEAFLAGRYAEAVENYTAALSCNVQSSPFAAICFCNRAAAYKASGQILDAIADCSLVIALSGNYIKAISRRATLFEMIRDYEQAAADVQRLISALTKQVEENTDQGGANDSLLSCSAELKQTRMKLAEMEDEARKDIPHDMYLILGVESSASMSEIKKAYRKAALRHHPDKATQFLSRNEKGDDKIWKDISEEVNKDADRLFKMIGVAYAILSDPVKRSQHDAEEEMWKAQKDHAAASTSRAYRGASNPPPFERSMRQPHTEVWRYYNSRQAHGPESTSWTR